MNENSQPIYSPRENDIFIAYSPEDDFFAKRLEKAIIKLGRDPWIDTQDLPEGLKSDMAEAWEHIETGIKNADVFVFILSPASIALKRNQQELELAVYYRKRLVPILYQTVEPNDIPASLQTPEVTWLTANATEPTATIEEIAKTILHIHIHQRLLSRVAEWDSHDRIAELLLYGADLDAVQRWFKQNVDRQPQLTPLQQQYIHASLQAEDKHTHPKQLDVFISYSRRDREFAEALCHQLKRHQLNIWVDWENIPIAADWRQEIQEGIESAHTFLFIISPDSVASPYCQDEIAQAISNNKRIISIVWRKDYDRHWFDKIPALATIRRHNWLHCNTVDALTHTTPKLIHAINTDLDYVKAHTRLLLQAIEWKTQERREEFLLRKTELNQAQAVLNQGKAIELQWIAQGRIEKLPFIPLPTELQEEFVAESAALETTIAQQEQKRQRRIQMLAITALGFLGLATFAAIAQVRTLQGEIEALVSSLEGNQGLDALITGLKAGKRLDQNIWIRWVNPSLQVRAVTALHQGVHSLKERNRLTGHNDRIYNISFSPDGKLLASASADGSVQLWRSNGQRVAVLTDHTQDVVNVEFNPGFSQTEYLLASASYDGTVKLWKIQTSNGDFRVELAQTLAAAPEPANLSATPQRIFSLSFSQGGQILALASEAGYVTLWNQTHQNQFALLKTLSHEYPVYNVSFSRIHANGVKLASADERGTIKVFTSQDSFQTSERLELNHNSLVLSLSFSPDGQLLASAGVDGTIKLWNLESSNGSPATMPAKVLTNHEGMVHRLAFSPDGQTFASASADGTVRLWQRDGTRIHTLRGHEAPVYRIQFSPDQRTIATAGADDTIRLWSSESGTLLDTLKGHREEILSIAFAPDGQTLASAGVDKTIRLWQMYRSEESPIRVLPHNNRVYDVAFRPDGKLLASSSWRTIRLWREDGTLLSTNEAEQDTDIFSIAFTPNGQRLVSASANGVIRLWQVDGGKLFLLDTVNLPNQAAIFSISLSPDGTFLASGGADGMIRLWQLEHSALRSLSAIPSQQGQVFSLDFSPDGQYLASAGENGTVHLWSQRSQFRDFVVLEHHRPTHQSPAEDQAVVSLSFSSDRQTLASAGSDGSIKLWRLDRLATIRTLNGATPGAVTQLKTVDFSPNGKLFAVAGEDGAVQLWNSNGTQMITLRRQFMEISNREISNIAFSANGQLLASASRDNTVTIWQLPGSTDNTILNELLDKGCEASRNYLSMDGMADEEIRRFCQQDQQGLNQQKLDLSLIHGSSIKSALFSLGRNVKGY
jgi:WD40 repeat protein